VKNGQREGQTRERQQNGDSIPINLAKYATEMKFNI